MAQVRADLCHMSSWTDAINDDIKPMVATIMVDKGTVTRGMHEKARLAKHVVKYEVLCTVWRFAHIWPDYLLKKELFEVGRIGVIMKFQLQETLHPCKCDIPTQCTLVWKSPPYWEVYNIIIKYHNSVGKRLKLYNRHYKCYWQFVKSFPSKIWTRTICEFFTLEKPAVQ